MQIEQDDYMSEPNQKKRSKTSTMVVVMIVITILVVIGIAVAIIMLTGNKLSVTIDGVKTSVEEDTFYITDDGDVYVSIKDIATYVGYEAHNGEYKVDAEDTNKMYVEALDGTETTSFFLNSTTISKVAPDSTDDYENIEIDEPVIMKDDKLYVSAEGFIVGFNSLFSYNQSTNSITIQTLPYLVSYYETKITDFGYSELSEEFTNQKALIYGMIVASKESTGKYGVISTSGVEIISPRYNEIEFVESMGEFITTNSSEKVGVMYSDGSTKITVSYDSIKVIDSTNGLYLVESNKKYGVINSDETLIVHIEYDQIGIDSSDYTADNITNQYVLCDTLIPVELNGKWGFYDIEGNKITEIEYDSVGADNSKQSDKIANNTLVISDTKVIVVSKDEKYGGIDVKGNYIIPITFDGIYSVTSGGDTNYYIVYNGDDYDAVAYIDAVRALYNLDEDGNTITEEETESEDEEIEENGTEESSSESNEVEDETESTDETSEESVNISE